MNLMTMMFILMIMMLNTILLTIFSLMGKKMKWELIQSSTFECGFQSYFFSRFSFSIHYFIIALIFLFLDLELCFLMPFMNEANGYKSSMMYFSLIVTILLMGLVQEWKEGKLEWKI